MAASSLSRSRQEGEALLGSRKCVHLFSSANREANGNEEIVEWTLKVVSLGWISLY